MPQSVCCLNRSGFNSANGLQRSAWNWMNRQFSNGTTSGSVHIINPYQSYYRYNGSCKEYQKGVRYFDISECCPSDSDSSSVKFSKSKKHCSKKHKPHHSNNNDKSNRDKNTHDKSNHDKNNQSHYQQPNSSYSNLSSQLKSYDFSCDSSTTSN